MNECPQHGVDCSGNLYIAVHTWDSMPHTKLGFVHPGNMPLRAKELARTGLQIIWTSGTRDHRGNLWYYSEEQAIHAQIRDTIQPPLIGREYYEISRPLITLLDERLLSAHRNNPRERRRAMGILAAHLARNGWWQNERDTGLPS